MDQYLIAEIINNCNLINRESNLHLFTYESYRLSRIADAYSAYSVCVVWILCKRATLFEVVGAAQTSRDSGSV